MRTRAIDSQVERHLATTNFSCRICGGTAGEIHIIREMMFGTRDEFRYVQCSECEALQLQNPPQDWSRYYRADYYAQGVAAQPSGIRQLLRNLRNRGTFLPAADPISRILAARNPYPIAGAAEWFRHIPIRADSRILDVGCGDGMIVQDLSTLGYRKVLGIDPFLATERTVAGGAQLRRADVSEIDGSFDVIMMHHSFEHVPDANVTLSAVARLLDDDGWALIRIPTVSSWAWKHYGTNWVQADAPRHFCLHSLQSIGIVAERSGLEIVRIDYDSIGFQIAGSELYARNVPLTELKTSFSDEELAQFEARAQQLNRDRQGDQIACYMRKSTRDAQQA
jgi:2-polyprenyl-3-methyl-5-hydroxy-6-metoxy-1,4-benzoquinol methylase/ribosomal protein S27E